MMIEHNMKAEPDKRLSHAEMVGNCNLFFLAGYDTTAQSLNSMLVNIALLPDVQERLAADVSKYGIDRSDVTIDELDKSELLEQVVKESLRVYPAVPFLFPRRLIKDFKLGQFNF